MLNRLRPFVLSLVLLLGILSAGARAETPALRVAVLENSPPMSYRDANGKLTGFSHAVISALCEEIKVPCEFQVTTLERVVDAVAQGEYDIAAVSLLETPERRAKVLFAKPYFRSISLWFALPGILPGQDGIRVAVVKGSAQERYALQQNWITVGVPTNGQLVEPLSAGVAQAAIIPMSTALNLQKDKRIQQQGISAVVMNAPELAGYAAFGINPRRPDLKEAIDEALERIKLNGTYDRINSRFLPFRVN
jgi:ABC-type amino acid transport substrate-binding protein